MKYFFITADSAYPQPTLKNWFNTLNPRVIRDGRYEEIKDFMRFQVESGDDIFLTDIISYPYFMVSEKMRDVMRMYDSKLEFKAIHLIDSKKHNNILYYIPSLDYVDCLSDFTQYNKDKSGLEHAVLDVSKIEGQRIFMLAGIINKYIVADLFLVESIIRRGIEGFKLNPIEIINKEGE